MTTMAVRFHTNREDLIFPDVEEGDGVWLQLDEVVVVDNGVDVGNGKTRPSVILRLGLPDGKSAFVITSARLVSLLSSMILARHPDLMEPDLMEDA